MGNGPPGAQVPSTMHRSRTSRTAAVLVSSGLVLAACSDSSGGDRSAARGDTATTTGDGTSERVDPAVDLPPPLQLEVPNPSSIYDPVRGEEPLPPGYRPLLQRDAIEPVYDPTFTTAAGVDWPDESLVIGVDLEGEARAYPVGFLNRREIVNDNHRGIPTLVTW